MTVERMDMPLVTVITPAYNCAKFITETINSVMLQDYRNIDYIVIDDASTDDTWEKLSRRIHPNIQIKHNANMGEQATVNEGLKRVRGKYFMIVNADDPLLPGAVSRLVEFMEVHPDILCAYPDYQVIGEDELTKVNRQTKEYDFVYMVKHHWCLPSVGSIFRTCVIDLVGYRDTSFRWLGDFDYWLRIGLVGKMARVPATLATWRNRDGQASKAKSDERAREHIRVIEKFFKEYQYSTLDLGDFILEARCWSYLVAVAVCKSKRMFIKYAYMALRTYPTIFVSLEFWDTFFKRAWQYLRR